MMKLEDRLNGRQSAAQGNGSPLDEIDSTKRAVETLAPTDEVALLLDIYLTQTLKMGDRLHTTKVKDSGVIIYDKIVCLLYAVKENSTNGDLSVAGLSTLAKEIETGKSAPERILLTAVQRVERKGSVSIIKSLPFYQDGGAMIGHRSFYELRDLDTPKMLSIFSTIGKHVTGGDCCDGLYLINKVLDIPYSEATNDLVGAINDSKNVAYSINEK